MAYYWLDFWLERNHERHSEVHYEFDDVSDFFAKDMAWEIVKKWYRDNLEDEDFISIRLTNADAKEVIVHQPYFGFMLNDPNFRSLCPP